MAKKAKKAAAKKARSPGVARKSPARAAARGFKVMALHVTEEPGRRAFDALKADRSAASVFAISESLPENLDPESAPKRILDHALASEAMPSLTAPIYIRVAAVEAGFKAAGID